MNQALYAHMNNKKNLKKKKKEYFIQQHQNAHISQ
jgi:hypothetical protein